METEITPVNDPRTYVGYDLMNNPYNSKYPPNKRLYGSSYEGYPTKAEGVLFYDFAVMGYDVEFLYKGKRYYLLNDGEAALTDSSFSKKIESFNDPMDLIENLVIDGSPLIKLLAYIEDIEPV